jgi:hypothetical protein
MNSIFIIHSIYESNLDQTIQYLHYKAFHFFYNLLNSIYCGITRKVFREKKSQNEEFSQTKNLNQQNITQYTIKYLIRLFEKF